MSDGTIQKPRIWHPSRDAYHCAFRFLRLLSFRERRVEIDRLRVLDMFLLYPPLIHHMSLPMDLRVQFRAINILRPADSFVRLPSAFAIFQDLRIYQNTAASYLTARAILVRDALNRGVAELAIDQVPAGLATTRQRPSLDFLGNQSP
jgi:hypothetical protein